MRRAVQREASTQLDAGYAGGCVCCDLVGGLISLSEATMAQSVKGNRWGWAFLLLNLALLLETDG